jgi:long-subunit fatty acid transport protein
VIHNTSALPEGSSESESGVAQEVAGAETVGMLGARVHTDDGITFALGVSYDNNQAWLVRPGITLKLR